MLNVLEKGALGNEPISCGNSGAKGGDLDPVVVTVYRIRAVENAYRAEEVSPIKSQEVENGQELIRFAFYPDRC